MLRLAIVGASGHGKVVLDAVLEEGKHEVIGFLDTSREVGSSFRGREVLGTQEEVRELAHRHGLDGLLVAIGDNWTRARVVDEVADRWSAAKFPAVVHPGAQVAESAELGGGTVVMAGAVVNPEAVIGEHCVVNTGATVDHDCQLGDFASVAPGAHLGGNVTLGEHAFVSLGGDVIHGVTIGAHTVVGAGAVVLEDLPARCVAHGTPATVRRQREPGESFL